MSGCGCACVGVGSSMYDRHGVQRASQNAGVHT